MVFEDRWRDADKDEKKKVIRHSVDPNDNEGGIEAGIKYDWEVNEGADRDKYDEEA